MVVLINKADVEQLRQEYQGIKRALVSSREIHITPPLIQTKTGQIVYDAMEHDTELCELLTQKYPLPEMIALTQLYSNKCGKSLKTPAYWMYDRFLKAGRLTDIAMQLLFGFATIREIKECYPNAFAFDAQSIYNDLKLLDIDLLQALFNAWDSVQKIHSEMEDELSKEADDKNRIASAELSIVSLKEELETIKTNKKSAIGNDNNNDTLSKEDLTPECVNTDLTPDRTTVQINKEMSLLRSQISSAQKHIDSLPKLRGDFERISMALNSTHLIYDEAVSMISSFDIRMSENREKLYTELSNHISMQKVVRYSQSSVNSENDDKVYYHPVEYVKRQIVSVPRISELRDLPNMPRSKSEWISLVSELSHSPEESSSFLSALQVCCLNTEGENRKVLFDMIKNRFFSCHTTESIADFVSALYEINEPASKKVVLLKALLDEKETQQSEVNRKELRMASVRAKAKVRDEFFSKIYRSVQDLEEYAWNQTVHDRGLFECIAAIRDDLRKVGINPVEDINAWIMQDEVDFNATLHHIDGMKIPQKVRIRTLGFKHTLEDGREEVVPAWVYCKE